MAKAASSKYCPQCKLTKPLSEFHKNRSRRDRRQTWCRTCHWRNEKRYRLQHPEKYKKQQKKLRVRNKLLKIVYLLEHPCADCGECDPLVLEFDHYRKKRKSISAMIKSQASWEAIQKEIARCEVRCANCHRRKTLLKLGWPDYLGEAA